MSKIGKQQISIPEKVKIHLIKKMLNVKGPKGELVMRTFDDLISLEINESYIKLFPKKTTKTSRAIWGLTRALINNMVIGVSKGFSKKLEINGIGYKASVNHGLLTLTLGFSHDIIYQVPRNVNIQCIKNIVEVSGCDKQLIGQVCADIKNMKKYEPYKSKGIKCQGEFTLTKQGKRK